MGQIEIIGIITKAATMFITELTVPQKIVIAVGVIIAVCTTLFVNAANNAEEFDDDDMEL